MKPLKNYSNLKFLEEENTKRYSKRTLRVGTAFKKYIK